MSISNPGQSTNLSSSFVSSFTQVQPHYLDYAIAVSFHVPFNSLVTFLPTIRLQIVRRYCKRRGIHDIKIKLVPPSENKLLSRL